jgi:hypothetical protein
MLGLIIGLAFLSIVDATNTSSEFNDVTDTDIFDTSDELFFTTSKPVSTSLSTTYPFEYVLLMICAKVFIL